jgi:AcrR family transcriptional regulator
MPPASVPDNGKPKPSDGKPSDGKPSASKSSAGKGGRYHHGDLRVALIAAAIELIGERGVSGFSMAEASRRLGVAASAPYAHFADRDELLAAVAVHAYQLISAEFLPDVRRLDAPPDRLAAIAAGYVRFAGVYRPLFELLISGAADKTRYPEIEVAERPFVDLFTASARALTGNDGSDEDTDDLATAIEAVALGHAMLLLDGDFGPEPDATEVAAGRAAQAALALIAGRRHLSSQPGPGPEAG